jgi:hypothetical protein
MFLTKVEISRNGYQTNSNTSDRPYQISPNDATCNDHSKSTGCDRLATTIASLPVGDRLATTIASLPTVGEGLATTIASLPTVGDRLATTVASQPTVGDRLATTVASQPTIGDRLATTCASLPTVGDRLSTTIASQPTIGDLLQLKQVCLQSVTCYDKNKSAYSQRLATTKTDIRNDDGLLMIAY